MPNWSMAEVSSPHDGKVKTSSQTAANPSAQSIIIFGGAISPMLVALDLKLVRFKAITFASISCNIGLF